MILYDPTKDPAAMPPYLERLRDEFAMAAAQGLLALHTGGEKDARLVAREAYLVATAMLEARGKEYP